MRALPLLVAAAAVAAAAIGAPAVGAPSALPGAPGAGEPRSLTAAQQPGAVANGSLPNRSVRVLSIPAGDVARSSHRVYRVDIGPGVGFGTNATDARLRTLAALERVRNAGSPAGRAREIRAGIRNIERRAESLRARERAAIAAYGDGEIGPRALLIRLARVDLAARELADRQALLAEMARESEGVALDQGRLARLSRRIDALTSPVREHVVSVLRGETGPSRIYVETGPGSVVLATIRDGEYLREAFRGDRYGADAPTIDPGTALTVTAESYPQIWETRRNNTDVTGSGGNYLVTVPHQRGLLRAYVTGSGPRVYKEFQRRPLATFEGSDPVTTVKDGLRLTVNRTYPGGPVRITLVDVETGDPVDANVTLGQTARRSELLGRTGADGTLWTLSPRDAYTVTAIRGNAAVVLTVRPAAPPRPAPAA